MLAIVFPCDQSACDGRVNFDVPALDDWTGRLYGVCGECRTAYTLYGGERRRVSAPDGHARPSHRRGEPCRREAGGDDVVTEGPGLRPIGRP